MAAVPDAGIDDFLATIAVTRLVLGPAMRVQAPPNLVSRAECLASSVRVSTTGWRCHR